MSYEYLLGIRLANPNDSIKLNEHPFCDSIYKAISKYNDCSKDGPNPKSIEIIPSHFLKHSFIIMLKSEKELTSPGRAIRTFSKIITELGDFDNYIKYGKVFSTFPVTKSTYDNSILKPEDICDADLLNSLIDSILKTNMNALQLNKKHEEGINKILDILNEANMCSVSKTNDSTSVIVLKSLIDYICNKTDINSAIYKRKRNAIIQIKLIALESEIYTIK